MNNLLSIEELMHKAVDNGDLEELKKVIDQKINSKDQNENTALHKASVQGHLSMVQFLIKIGANIEVKGKDELAPLHAAVSNGHLEVVKCLIDNGAQIEANSNDELTPLHYSVSHGYLEITKHLIYKGAKIEAKDKNGSTPLHFAWSDRHLEVAKCLIENGAQKEAMDRNGTVPLHFAVVESFKMVELMLQSGAKTDQINRQNQNFTALHISVQRGSLAIVKCLVKYGSQVDATDKIGRTSLHLAVIGRGSS